MLVAGDPKPGGRRRPNVLFARLTERGTLASLDVRRVRRGGSATGPAAILPRGAVLNDFAVHGRRIVGVGTDEIDDRIDYASYFVLAAFKG